MNRYVDDTVTVDRDDDVVVDRLMRMMLLMNELLMNELLMNELICR